MKVGTLKDIFEAAGRELAPDAHLFAKKKLSECTGVFRLTMPDEKGFCQCTDLRLHDGDKSRIAKNRTEQPFQIPDWLIYRKSWYAEPDFTENRKKDTYWTFEKAGSYEAVRKRILQCESDENLMELVILKKGRPAAYSCGVIEIDGRFNEREWIDWQHETAGTIPYVKIEGHEIDLLPYRFTAEKKDGTVASRSCAGLKALVQGFQHQAASGDIYPETLEVFLQGKPCSFRLYCKNDKTEKWELLPRSQMENMRSDEIGFQILYLRIMQSHGIA